MNWSIINLMRHNYFIGSFLFLLFIYTPSSFSASISYPNNKNEVATTRAFERIKQDPNALTAFLKQMPKGGDLHNHLSGAIFAESYIDWAIKSGLCIDLKTLKLTQSTDGCSVDKPTVKQALSEDDKLYDRIIDTWSMRNSEHLAEAETGHEHFFSTFGKYKAVSCCETSNMLADVTARAQREKLSYLELMLNPDHAGIAKQLGSQLRWSANLESQRRALIDYRPSKKNDPPSIADLIKDITFRFNDIEKRQRDELGCTISKSKEATVQPDGCSVTTRYIFEVGRTLPNPQVFAQMVVAFELAKSDSRFVGLNLVKPEDSLSALKNFDEQMRMLNYLHIVYPTVHISLHAGELVPGLSPPETLRHHITDSVLIGHAERIGHGVDIMNEDNPYATLKKMAARNVLVEICLSSNKYILGIRGKHSPLKTYMNYGVPVALATDDAGVSRSTISQEYQLAVENVGISYPELKNMARASLEYAFIQGDSLWENDKPFKRKKVCTNLRTASCVDFIQSNPKAQLQKQLELNFATFERRYASCDNKAACLPKTRQGPPIID